MVKRALAAFFAVLLTLSVAPVSALAQSDAGEIDIDVQDATAKTPVILARVLLDGPVIASEFTGNNGKVKFTDVPNGIYHARVFARGYQAVTSEQFEIVGGRVASVTVLLAPSTNLKIIGSVVAKSSASVSSNTINADSAQRKLSNDLADALNKLSGVSVSTSSNDSDATQTVSLEGHDASQTQLTLDGIPLNAPGTAGDLRSIGTDMFTGASVSMGPQLGGLGGGVNFRTLDPTLTWQSAFSVSAGSYGKNNYSAAETGSLGKLGVAMMHTYRSSPSIADGMYYEDASGLAYSHAGDSTQIGSNVKLRYQLTPNQTITGSYLSSTNNSDVVCLQFTGPLPCGYGPGNSRNGKFTLYSLMDSALVGDTALQASVYGTKSTNVNDLTNRFVNGVAAPTGTTSTLSTRGFMLNATLPARERHTISFSAYSTSTTSQFDPLVSQAAPYTIPGQSSSYSAISINDAIQSSPKLKLTESFGLNKSSNSSSSILASSAATWKPTNNDTFSASYSVGGAAPHIGRAGFLTDPAQLRFDCSGDVAYGSAPGDQPAGSSSTSARLGYSRQLKGGVISASLYRQVQNGVVLPAQVNGAVLAGGGIFPPGYFNVAQNIFNSAAGCNAPPSTPFGPQNVYFSTPIGGVQRVYQGGSITGYVTLGNLVLQPYYNITSATIRSSDPRLNNAFSIEIPGEQVPNVPLHRAGLTMDYKARGSSLEWLASANYTGANNPQNLPAFTTVDAGVSAQLTHGTLTLAASNVFNAYSGVFASSENAVPYTTLGGTSIPTIARPNAPRQISMTYSVKFGENAQQRSIGANAAAVGREGGNRGGFRGMLSPLPDTPPANPFQLAQTPLCTADAQKSAQPLLDDVKAYAAKIESMKTAAGYPQTVPAADIPGVSVTYHPLGDTYALSLSLRDASKLRATFGCLTLHIADQEQVQQRHLYVTQGVAGFTRPSVTFMPATGFYFARQQPQAGAESFRVYKLPATPPSTPFALRTAATACTPEMHSLAQQYLGELDAHFAKNATAHDWTITPHTSSGGTWYSLEPGDIGALGAILMCGRVATGSKDDLAKAGFDAAEPPALNYSKPLGLYILQMRFGPGGPNGQRPSPPPTPSGAP